MSPLGRALDVWYTCDQTLCNFACSYCVTWNIRSSAGPRMWATKDGAQRFSTVIGWLEQQPYRLRLRLQTHGEPFVSRQFLAGAARLTHAPNVEFVEVVTNASFTEEQLDDFVGRCSVDRLSMWATFHPTQIELDQFLEGVKGASDRGAHVVAHALLFPDTIEVVKELLAACEVLGIRTDVTLGNNFNDAYPGRGPIPMAGRRAEVEALYRSPVALEALGVGLIMPYGERCSAGHDYVRIMENGDVYPCGPYAISRLDRLGSAVDPLFSLVVRETRYRACASGMTCFCKEDYFHLELVRERLRFPRSLGYYETLPEEPATGLHPVAE